MDLAELSKASRVPPRTIRYYIHMGLLPSPGKRGRGARYDRGLLDRLQLIKLLARDQWPLGKIADHMAELDDEGVRRALGAPPELALGDIAGPAVDPLDRKRFGVRKSTWERVRVGARLEISVRKPLSAEQRKRMDRLVKTAKRFFAD